MSNAFATVFRKRVESAANRFHGLIYGFADTPKRLERLHAAIRESLLPLEPVAHAVETYERDRARDLDYARAHFKGTGRYASDAEIEAAAEADMERRRPVYGFDSVPKFFPAETEHPYRLSDKLRLLARLYSLVGVNPNEPLEPVWDASEQMVYANATGPLVVWHFQDAMLRDALSGECLPEEWAALVERLDGWVVEAEEWVQSGADGARPAELPVNQQDNADSANPPSKDEKIPDGPYGVSGFRFRGAKIEGIPNLPWKLLNALWNAPQRTLEYAEIVTTVWGDPNMDVANKTIQTHCSTLRKLFRDNGIALEIETVGDPLRVGLVISPPDSV